MENGRWVYFAPVSFAAFTGEPDGMARNCSKSPLGLGSLKTMVLSSGVSIVLRPSLSADLSL